jgi:hypothetical protein
MLKITKFGMDFICKNCSKFFSKEPNTEICNDCMELKMSLLRDLQITEQRITKLQEHQDSLTNFDKTSNNETNRRLTKNLEQLDKKINLIKMELQKLDSN